VSVNSNLFVSIQIKIMADKKDALNKMQTRRRDDLTTEIEHL
jgi:hypothetical protein